MSFDPSPYRECVLCPRLCGVNRLVGERGVCGETAACRVASMGPHFGEEPPLSGCRGSGTIFFSGCSCRCFFCQNWQISRDGQGEVLEFSELCRRTLALVARGVHNLNFVTPEHMWPHIRALCRWLRREGVELPFLWNGSAYSRAEFVPDYAEWMDIFLPDFKFADAELARRCMGDRRYPEIAMGALERMVEEVGFLTPWSESGRVAARRGVLVRHLVLPGEVDNSIRVLHRLHERFGPGLPLSVMSQFSPTPACREAGALCRTVTGPEYESVCEVVEALGFEHVFIQPGGGDDAFLPDFTAEEPFSGNAGTEM